MAKSVKRNYIYSLIYEVLAIIIPLITAPYLSRILGADGIGMVSYTKSIAQYFAMFAILGITNYGNRTISAIRDDRQKMSQTFWNIYAFQFALALLVFIIYLVYLAFFVSQYRFIALIQGFYIIANLLDISWFFFGLEEFKTTVTKNSLIKLFTFGFVFIFVKKPDDVWVYALIAAGSHAIAQLFLWIGLRKKVSFEKPSIRQILPHIKPILVLFIPVITISIYKVMDKIMIGAICGDMYQSGIYENADKIIRIPLSVITALGSVMLPRMSNIFAKGKNENALILIRDTMQFSLGLSVALSFGLCAVAPTFVPVYFGNGFSGCETVIQILAFSTFLISWANVIRTQYLIPKKRDKEYIISVTAGAVVNLIINFCLIPSMGAVGAAIGTLIAEFTVTTTQTLLIWKELPYSVYFKDLTIFIIPGISMFVVVNYISQLAMKLFLKLVIEIGVGAFVYCVFTVILFAIFDRERLYYYKKIVFK